MLFFCPGDATRRADALEPCSRTLNEFQACYLRVYSFKEEGVCDAIAVG
jgi:hypothetical protein